MNQRGGRWQSTPRGRSPRPTGGRSPHYRANVGADGYPVDDSFDSNDGMSHGGRTNPQQRSRGGASKHFEPKPSTGYRQKQPEVSGAAGFSNVVRHQEGQSFVNPTGGVSKPPESVTSGSVRPNDLSVLYSQPVSKDVNLGARRIQSVDDTGDTVALGHDFSDKVKIMCQQDKSRSNSKSGAGAGFGVGDSVNKGTKNTEDTGNSDHPEHMKEVGADGHRGDDSFGSNDGMFRGGRTNLQQRSQGSVSQQFEPKPSSGNMYRQKQPAFKGGAGFSNVVRHQQGQSSVNPKGGAPKPSEYIASDSSVLSSQPDSKDVHLDARTIPYGDDTGGNSVALHRDFSDKVQFMSRQDESRLNSKPGAGVGKNNGNSDHPEQMEEIKRFDLCPSKGGSSIKLKPSLLERNREKRNEIKRSHEGQHGSILRPGMVLLKNFLSLNDQIKIVKHCRDLGIGTGGFYQPGYGDGRELHLKMMCLGKNWDPETSKYGDIRPHDHASPPKIPNMFSQLVLKAIEDSHALIRTKTKVTNIQNVLPSMSPNICIINFYTATGRLGLHQDKDETLDSLCRGLPVVSLSIGDSAEFLYGDERDVEKAEKVVLESGDVLIFGGKSRHVFHGVSSIRSNTAPKALLEETNLRPGRLNLTFREY